MFSTEVDPNRTRQRHRLRVLIVAAAAAAAILIPVQQRAEAAEVCTGPECDTVAFVNDASQLSLYQDLVPSSPIGTFYYGDTNDELLMGDWNCSGEQTPGMYRRSTGSVYLRNSNTPGVADLTYVFGNPGDVPVVGDFDGDGCDTLGIYRPSQSRFYISNSLSGGVAEDSFAFGTYGDMPIVGDFDGDGVDTVGSIEHRVASSLSATTRAAARRTSRSTSGTRVISSSLVTGMATAWIRSRHIVCRTARSISATTTEPGSRPTRSRWADSAAP